VDRAFENEDDPDLKPKILSQIIYTEQLDQLLENEDDNVNPFWVRELRFECEINDELLDQEDEEIRAFVEEYWAKVIQLLERYGHHVHRIDVDFDDEYGNPL